MLKRFAVSIVSKTHQGFYHTLLILEAPSEAEARRVATETCGFRSPHILVSLIGANSE